MVHFYNSLGKKIRLIEKIGSGGEGNVYKIDAENKTVAKIYHKRIDNEKQQKIKAMIKSADKALKSVTAWPLDTLSKSRNGEICGFIMPSIMGCEPVHHIYSPSHRKQQFPEIDWAFLINVCRNIASAFATVHAKGHVIGDVNPNLVFISKDTVANLIDCDSFQINHAGKIYPCEVGVAHFTPPELQGLKSFKGVERTANHDNFGLSLLIFHLLMMGRHPFSGIYSGTTHRSLENSIKNHLYAFSDKTAKKNQITPPPHSVKPDVLSDNLKLLFEKSFSEFGSKFYRPSAKEWMDELDSFKKQIKSCSLSLNHKYYNRLSNCPWCDLSISGVSYFPAISHKAMPLNLGFDKDLIWSKISAVTPPKKVSLNIREQIKSLSKKVQGKEVCKKELAREQKIFFKKIFAVFIVVACYFLWFDGVLFSLLPAGYLFFSKINLDSEREKRKKALEKSQNELYILLKKWDKEGSDAIFYKKIDELKTYYKKYNNLNLYYENKFNLLQKNKRDLQLNYFLKKFYISSASIKGIGAVRKADLASFGIETAADIYWQNIIRVSGFGDKYTKKMIAWRKELESKFIFNPSKAIDVEEIYKLKNHVAEIKNNLENKLLSSPRELMQLRNNIERKRKLLLPAIATAVRNTVQAKADLQVLENLR